MATTDLGACEWFVWDLRRSNLLDRGQLDQVVGEYLRKHPRSEPPQLAEYLVQQRILTQFQADRILQGKAQGLVLGPYTLVDSIGSGSMGTVYKAQSKTDGKGYAVKVLPRRSMWNVRLARRQVRAFEQFNHPGVVPFVDVGTSGGQHYLAWPLIEGETLDKLVEQEGKLTPEVAALYTLQTAAGLQSCHQHSIFHGLLKPSNLMLADGQVRILDLGIGALLSENEESLVDTMSTANTVTSGLDCASPESIMEPTNRTAAGDQYSLGCSLYYFLTGKYPFPEGSAVEKMMAHQYKQPTPIKDLAPNVPDGLVAVVEQLMQKKPEDRFASCEEVVDALRPFAAQAAPPASKRSPGKAQPQPGRQPAENGEAPSPAMKKSPGPAIPTRKDMKAPPPAPSKGRAKEAALPPADRPPSQLDRLKPAGGGGGAKAAPAPPPKRELPPEPEYDEEEEDLADEAEEEEEEEEAGEGRSNTLLIVIGALIIAGLAFYMALQFFGKGG
jgi:serine/threonine-protein kinase